MQHFIQQSTSQNSTVGTLTHLSLNRTAACQRERRRSRLRAPSGSTCQGKTEPPRPGSRRRRFGGSRRSTGGPATVPVTQLRVSVRFGWVRLCLTGRQLPRCDQLFGRSRTSVPSPRCVTSAPSGGGWGVKGWSIGPCQTLSECVKRGNCRQTTGSSRGRRQQKRAEATGEEPSPPPLNLLLWLWSLRETLRSATPRLLPSSLPPPSSCQPFLPA